MPRTRDGEPTYRRIADDLRNAIRSGELQDGERLPSYTDLTKRYGVALLTVKDALAVLQGEGLIVARHGKGTFVRVWETIRRHSGKRLSRERWGQGQAIQDADTGVRPRVLNLAIDEIAPPAHVRDALKLDEDAAVVLRRSRQFAVDDRSVQLATSYLPLDLVAGSRITEADTGPGGVYARLAELGEAPVRFTETLRARMPTPEEARTLELPPGTPVVAITRLAFTEQQRCVEVNDMLLDASAYELVYDVEA